MIIKTNFQKRSQNDPASVGLVLDDIWKQIREKNLYSGQPRARQSVEALALAKTAVAMSARTKVRRHSAQACGMAAMTLNANEQYSASVRYYRRALAGLDSLGSAEQAARTRLGFVAALGMIGHYQEAIDEAKAANEWFEGSGDNHGRARLLTNIGNVHLRRENYEEALQCHSRAHELFASVGDENALAVSSLNFANCLSNLGQFDRAEEVFSQAEELSRKLALADLNRQIRYNHNYLVFLLDHFDEALRGFQELKREFRKQKSAQHVALCDLDSASIYLRKNMPAAALRHARKAAGAFSKLRMRYEQAKALVYTGVALIQTRRFKKSLAALQSAQALFRAEGNAYWIAVLDVWQAYVRVALKQTSTARAFLNRARLRLQQIDTQTKRFETIRRILTGVEDNPEVVPDLKISDVLNLIN